MAESSVRALARRFVPGHGEPEICELQSGLANVSYKVTRDAQDFVLRVRAARGEAPGVEREWERRVLDAVSAARLAPQVLDCAPTEGVLLTRWITGASWSAAQSVQPWAAEQVAGLARRVHAVPPPLPARAMSPALWRILYLDALQRADLDAVRRATIGAWGVRALRVLNEYAALAAPVDCLCHSDIHRHNVLLSDSGLVLLDWEYAHVGDPFWDLAGWISCNDLPIEAGERFLAAYLQREAIAAERIRLHLLSTAYDYICLLWIELFQAAERGSDAPVDTGLARRAELLAARFVAG